MAGRSPFQQAFRSTSIFNIPIGASATYALPQPTSSQGPLFPATIRSMTSDDNIVLMDPSQPSTLLAQSTTGNRCAVGATLTHIPMATNYVAAYGGGAFTVAGSGGNNALSSVLGDGITLTGGEPFARCVADGAGTVVNLAQQNGSLFDAGLGTSGALSDGPHRGGSGLSTLGGIIRLGELVTGGVIPHALAINIYAAVNCFNGFVWPAYRKDGYVYSPGGTNPKLAPGALLAIPPSVFSGMSFNTVPGEILATAFMNYGGYVVNDTARSVNAICTEWGPRGYVAEPLGTPGEFQNTWGFPFTSTLSGAWALDCAAIFAALHLVTSNTLAQYNTNISNYATGNSALYTGAGGGAPLVTMAPNLGGSALAPVWANQSTGSEHFTPNASTQISTWNPSLLFAGIGSEEFNVTPVYPVTIGATVACGTSSLPATTLMSGN